MTRVVLDTNVYLSALFWKGTPFRLFQKVLAGKVENYISAEIIEEINDRLANKF